MKSGNILCAIAIVTLITGCANPLNQTTSDRYSETCAEAERSGNMPAAAEACYRAYVNVEWGNLGPELRSEKLYNFGRVLRRAGRFDDSKEALSRAVAEEEKLTGKNSIKTGRRMAELAATYYELNQLEEGVALVDRLIPLASNYSNNEKQFIAVLLYEYSLKIGKVQSSKAALYKTEMKNLGYSESYFEKMR